MNVRAGFTHIHTILTGEGAPAPTERERLALEIAQARRLHRPVCTLQRRLEAITHEELGWRP